MDSRVVTRELKRQIWPILREHGFDVSTSRTAWRHKPHRIEVIDFPSLGHYHAERLGCTSFSFQVELGSALPAHADYQSRQPQARWPTPRPPDCEFRLFLNSPRPHVNLGATIWYVDAHGASLAELISDVTAQLDDIAWPWFDRWADDRRILRILENGEESNDGTNWPHPHAVGPRSVLIGTLKHRLSLP